ncbi:MAG: hypothetical protein C4582_02210 [Desulfobacteraceae bacterium]|jgi:hypothetical protein|nr:MAG: hypothetical protein C4582_02210 [Desulfobacteraceae bacterium]
MKILISIFSSLFLIGCGTPKSALNWNKLEIPYHDRVIQARAQQVDKLREKGEPVKSELQRTEEALKKAISIIFDGKEAELKGDTAHPLSDQSARQWRVEELILLYHPEIIEQLAALDQLATAPNLLLTILNQLQISGSAALVGGIFEIKSNESGNSELIFSNDGRSVYETRLSASLGLGSLFEDTRSLIAFERQFLQFRSRLITKHALIWPIIEEYNKSDIIERESRSRLLIKELLARQ